MGALARMKSSRRSQWSDGNAEPASVRTTKARQSLDPQLQFLIGDQLRIYYAELLREPMPDRFLEVLRQLSSTEGKES
jgi:Anti-sigma factor NepR